MEDITFSVKFSTYRIGNFLEWDVFCSRINEVINIGNKGAALNVFIDPPMSKKEVYYVVRSIVKMIQEKHNCTVTYFPENTVAAAGLDDEFIREITFYFSYQIK